MIVRGRVAFISAALVALIVFLAYGVPGYFHLVAHQPGRDPAPTSFPPYYAFVVAGWFAFLSFVFVLLLFLVVRVVVGLFGTRKSTSGTRVP
jgi:hypothetical protein